MATTTTMSLQPQQLLQQLQVVTVLQLLQLLPVVSILLCIDSSVLAKWYQHMLCFDNLCTRHVLAMLQCMTHHLKWDTGIPVTRCVLTLGCQKHWKYVLHYVLVKSASAFCTALISAAAQH